MVITPIAPQSVFLSFSFVYVYKVVKFPCKSMTCDARFSYQGTGTLRSDDDTRYEGEFAADMQLHGKVKLCSSA